MSETVLEVRDLKVRFETEEGWITAVDGLSFSVASGQTLGIVGESGSGKSVTSLAIAGLVPQPPGQIAGGEIFFRPRGEGETLREPLNLAALSDRALRDLRGSQIATIFQEPAGALNPVYTIGFQLVEAICRHQSLNARQARRKATALLQEVKLLPSDEDLRREASAEFPEADDRELLHEVVRRKQEILDRFPHELSGGQIQRVTIAMALSSNPTLLIADEPTTALDVTVQARILELLRDLRDRRQIATIFISHDLGVIAEIADAIAVTYRGRIVEYGRVRDIFANPQHPYTKGLLACRPQLGSRLRYLPTVADFMEVTPDREIIEKTDELDLEEIDEREAEKRIERLQQQEPLLRVRDLQVGFPIKGVFGRTKRYFMAVNGMSFDVYPGETLGLVGESGCGKSTLARALLRLVKPMGGEIHFDGRDTILFAEEELRGLRREMQIVFQDPFGSLDPRMTVEEAILEPLKIHNQGRRKRDRSKRVAYLLERVGLDPNWARRFPHEFSGGQRQRICIARALALNPKFIICDESVSALDVSVQAQVLNLLKELQDEFQLTYIFISHDLSVVQFMSDRIMVANRGKIEEIGPAAQIYREPQTEYARALIASIPAGTLERIEFQQQRRALFQNRAG